jgi:Uma2 family endonuclease
MESSPATPDDVEHYRINHCMLCLVADYLEEKELDGEVFGYRIAFRLDEYNGSEPDLGFLKANRVHLIRRDYIDGPPDWVVEIVSSDSVERDYHKKRQQFEHAGVPEYWIIDPLTEKVTCLWLGKDGKYRAIQPKKGILACKAIPGFWLRTSWFWEKPLPGKKRVLAKILSGAK